MKHKVTYLEYVFLTYSDNHCQRPTALAMSVWLHLCPKRRPLLSQSILHRLAKSDRNFGALRDMSGKLGFSAHRLEEVLAKVLVEVQAEVDAEAHLQWCC
jgi:hypothetical protein